MKKGMDFNHTLLGLHTDGNECYTDIHGAMIPFDLDGLDCKQDQAKDRIRHPILPEL